ncbi:hypothetical protein PBAL39_17259 [Pedobacter sp. BAL39]|nr:hypothetical protein PBAL39_17259 [Pedobacter sp. BAL39]
MSVADMMNCKKVIVIIFTSIALYFILLVWVSGLRLVTQNAPDHNSFNGCVKWQQIIYKGQNIAGSTGILPAFFIRCGLSLFLSSYVHVLIWFILGLLF